MEAASTTVARRYAAALFATAVQGERVDAIEQDLAAVENAIRQAPRLLETLRNPLVPAERKQRIVDQLFADSLDETSIRFLHLLIEKRRSEVLPYVHNLYVEMANEYRGILPAFVTSAVPLTADEEKALMARLQELSGRRILLHKEVKPELIGGVRVRLGDTVIDGTVVGYLRRLRETLKQTLV